ncbi:ABC transporter ATP-binding protein [Sporichthya brevicatena]|uniref:ABC transporter ATP-binding protein n=1 Tax=Sporichthya brevicatena TaxID=171442 RepID=A0ABN1H9Y4_9ACTN
MTSPALQVETLTVRHSNGHLALDGVELTVPAGARIGVVGASGCGKTTLLRAVLGLLPPAAEVTGRILVGGRDVLALSTRERRALLGPVIGYVAQDPFAACDPLRSVRHHVGEAWTAHGRRPPPGAIVDALARVGIPAPQVRAGQRPYQWSGGMLQRATTVAATAHGPLLTLADEPTSALDADLADDALELLVRTSSALLLVSHDLALVARHTDHIVVLSDGQIVEENLSHTLLCSPVHNVTRALVRAARPRPLSPLPARPDAPAVARVHQARRSYRVGPATTTAVDGVCLRVRAGEVVGIVGASGSGKSTLLRIVAGMERPDAGTVLLGDTPVWGRSRAPQTPRPGYVMPVFQNPVSSLDARWSIWRSVTEPLVLRGARLSRTQRRDRARAELAAVGLDGLDVDRLPGSLSVGQCQRVAVVRALIAEPALVVADEPTASLDVEAAATVAAYLRSAADRGVGVLVVSHDEPRLRSYADRVLRMREGKLCGAPAPVDPTLSGATGSPRDPRTPPR